MTNHQFLAVIALPFLWLIGAAIQPPVEGQKADKDQPLTYNLKTQFELKAERINGAHLDINAKQEIDARSDRILVRWTLEYEGPRLPFITLEPTLARETAGQTIVRVFATGKSGTTYGLDLSSPHGSPFHPGGPSSRREWFVRVPRGRVAVGTISVVTADLRRFFAGKLPQEFGPTPPPQLHVRLYHCPTDRGQHLMLDAWTGQLHSDVIPVEMKEW